MWYTSRGDEGVTDLLGGERTAKDAPRLEAIGDLDETSSAVGVARAACLRAESKATLLQIQRTLYLIMGEIASPHPEHLAQRLGAEAVNALEAEIATLETRLPPLRGFVAPGDTPAGAALDLARAVARRAERRVVSLHREGEVSNAHLLRYLNRLSSLLFLLARVEDAAAGQASTQITEW